MLDFILETILAPPLFWIGRRVLRIATLGHYSSPPLSINTQFDLVALVGAVTLFPVVMAAAALFHKLG